MVKELNISLQHPSTFKKKIFKMFFLAKIYYIEKQLNTCF